MVGVGQDERPHPGEPGGAGEVPQVGVVVRLQVQHVVQPPRREVGEQVHSQIPATMAGMDETRGTCEVVFKGTFGNLHVLEVVQSFECVVGYGIDLVVGQVPKPQ